MFKMKINKIKMIIIMSNKNHNKIMIKYYYKNRVTKSEIIYLKKKNININIFCMIIFCIL